MTKDFLLMLLLGICGILTALLFEYRQPLHFEISKGTPCLSVEDMSHDTCEEVISYTVPRVEATQILGQMIKTQGGYFKQY